MATAKKTPVARKMASPAAKAPAKKVTAAKPPAKAAAPAVPAAPKLVKALKAEKPKKPKLVRDSFTIPKAEYTVLDELKQRAATHVLCDHDELVGLGAAGLRRREGATEKQNDVGVVELRHDLDLGHELGAGVGSERFVVKHLDSDLLAAAATAEDVGVAAAPDELKDLNLARTNLVGAKLLAKILSESGELGLFRLCRIIIVGRPTGRPGDGGGISACA